MLSDGWHWVNPFHSILFLDIDGYRSTKYRGECLALMGKHLSSASNLCEEGLQINEVLRHCK